MSMLLVINVEEGGESNIGECKLKTEQYVYECSVYFLEIDLDLIPKLLSIYFEKTFITLRID